MRYQGRITNWKDDQGFGFITFKGSDNQVFVHIKAFKNRKRRPAGNELVTYELVTDPKGRKRAENVVFVVDRSSTATAPKDKGSAPLLLAILFIIFVTAMVFEGKLPRKILGLYFWASLIAFTTYAWDKSAAQKNHWRTSESTLLLLGIIGGWPGALFAQQLLRHKSKKQSFQITFWATVILNCGALIWLLTPEGSSTLSAILKSIA